ncbi:MAG: hypothetical protein VKO39_13680 [Cyanobacteriota bacterium]|nr:hypothetical protein [Cyanobacteriota bacterium]
MDDALFEVLTAYKKARDFKTTDQLWDACSENPLMENLLDTLEQALYEHEQEEGAI